MCTRLALLLPLSPRVQLALVVGGGCATCLQGALGLGPFAPIYVGHLEGGLLRALGEFVLLFSNLTTTG